MRALKSVPVRLPRPRDCDPEADAQGARAGTAAAPRRHLVLVTPSRRYAAIVNGFQLVLPSFSWRRLNGPIPDEIGIADVAATPSRRTWNTQLAERLAGQLPADLDRLKTIPVVLLPDRTQWEGGPLSPSETDILFGAFRKSAGGRGARTAAASTAVDALGARLLLRFFETGHLEIIPFASDVDVQPSARIRPFGSRAQALAFAFVKPISVPTSAAWAGTIQLDAGGIFSPAELPEDPAELARFAGALYWEKINPALGRPFHDIPGVLVDQGGDRESQAHAAELVRMALRADAAVAGWNVCIELPLHDIGIPRVRGFIYPPRRAGAAATEPDWTKLVLPMTAAIFAVCSRWEVHTDHVVQPHDPFATPPFGNVRRRTLVLGHADTLALSAHDAILEHDILALFWRTHRDDVRVLNALAEYPATARAALDRIFGAGDELR